MTEPMDVVAGRRVCQVQFGTPTRAHVSLCAVLTGSYRCLSARPGRRNPKPKALIMTWCLPTTTQTMPAGRMAKSTRAAATDHGHMDTALNTLHQLASKHPTTPGWGQKSAANPGHLGTSRTIALNCNFLFYQDPNWIRPKGTEQMSANPQQRPPKGLLRAGRAKWRDATADYEYDPAEAAVLLQFCRTADHLEALEGELSTKAGDFSTFLPLSRGVEASLLSIPFWGKSACNALL